MIYEKVLRPILFKFTDPEDIHHRVIRALGFVSRRKVLFSPLKKYFAIEHPALQVEIGKMKFPTPVGLAAGFDKYIEAPLAYAMLGFGSAELGSITFSEQAGNPKPRLWRIPDDKGLIVYYGLANAGANKTHGELSKIVQRHIPYGISIAPTTGLSIEQMADDYIKTFLHLQNLADYITFNVSCPNVAACDMFAQVNFIENLMDRVRQTMDEKQIDKDIFIKIGPHHASDDLDRIIDSALKNKFTGIVATNLIKDRSGLAANSKKEHLDRPGGISGKLLGNHSDKTIRYVYERSGGKLKVIGVGGIFTAEDAYKKIKHGASAVQLITGFIYGGPTAIKKINEGLLKLLQRDGFKNISEAVGKDVR